MQGSLTSRKRNCCRSVSEGSIHIQVNVKFIFTSISLRFPYLVGSSFFPQILLLFSTSLRNHIVLTTAFDNCFEEKRNRELAKRRESHKVKMPLKLNNKGKPDYLESSEYTKLDCLLTKLTCRFLQVHTGICVT